MIVPKKSAPGEPPKQSMYVDYCRINALQTKVESSSKDCMSLYPLPKIDEMFAKLHQDLYNTGPLQWILLIGTVYPNIPLSSASLHGHP